MFTVGMVQERAFCDLVQVDAPDYDADTALHTATSALHLDIMKRLTDVIKDDMLAELLAKPNVRGNTPLHCAFDTLLEGETKSSKTVTKAVQHLVSLHKKHNISIDLQDKERATALFLASKYSVSESVKLLIEAGADVNIANSWGDTPLTAASAAPSVPIMKALLQAGADPSATLERSKETAMHIVIHANLEEREVVSICEALIDAGGDVNALDIDEKSPVVRAAEHHRQKLVRFVVLLLPRCLLHGAAHCLLHGAAHLQKSKSCTPVGMTSYEPENDIVMVPLCHSNEC